MTEERAELVVVGAGPAGLAAAVEAARAGIDVTLVDESPKVGGQIFRQLPDEFCLTGAPGRDLRRGQAASQELSEFPVRFLGATTVWSLSEGGTLDLARVDRSFRLTAPAVILATGAYDRPVPLPGWTLPGVITVGGAQILLKTQRILPEGRILIAGTGPLLLVVASQLVQAGANVVAVAEAVPARSLITHWRALASATTLALDGLRYRWNVLKAGVPWKAPAILTRIDGERGVERATIARVGEDWRPIAGTERSFEADTVCVGYGLLPSVELARLCGCAMHYDPVADAWLPDRDENFETSVSGVFVVGDGAGVGGAVVAAEEGRIAGFAVAQRLRDGIGSRLAKPMARARRRLRQLARFRTAMDSVYGIRPGLHELGTADTILCRCEEVRFGEIHGTIAEGLETLDEVKAHTRAGMGSCQARMCGIPTAHLVSRLTDTPIERVGCYRVRPPVKPVPIEALVSDGD